MSDSETFSSVFEEMKIHGMRVETNTVRLSVPNAKDVFNNAMTYFLSLRGCKYAPQPEYSEIINWLSDNKGRGLLLYGNCGRGKTMIGKYVLPAILLKYCRKVVSCYDIGELDAKVDEALSRHILSIDDIGTETVAINYGKKRMPFSEIMDAAEKYGKLVIITSNSTKEDLKEKYGDRVYDRIIATTIRIPFIGESLRT